MSRHWLVALAITVAFVLHQDFWNWADRSIVLGLFPVGLAYHVGYSLLASVLLAWVVRVAWPAPLDADVTVSSEPVTASSEPAAKAGESSR